MGLKMLPKLMVAGSLMAVLSAAPAYAQWTNYDGYQAIVPNRDYNYYPAYPVYPVAPPDAIVPPYRRPPVPADGYYDPRYDPEVEERPYRGGRRGSSELGTAREERTAQVVSDPTHQAPGTIVVDTGSRHLYLVRSNGQAIRYGIGVGRQGFEWKGEAHVGRKAEWPRWIPPAEMLKRRPDLPESMEGGLENPLGARALYLFQGNKDTLFRIHGTNEPDTIGQAVSSGCIRMMNDDVIDLYQRVSVGARVVVM
jgi:lipoprotein-anchoring transpeptidase ErfK/SrfK